MLHLLRRKKPPPTGEILIVAETLAGELGYAAYTSAGDRLGWGRNETAARAISAVSRPRRLRAI